MPAKLIQIENILSFSSVLHRPHIMPHMPEMLEISNHHNFDLLYVFERPTNVDRESRLELMRDIFEDDTPAIDETTSNKTTSSQVDNLNLKSNDQNDLNVQNISCSSKTSVKDRTLSPDKSDLINFNDDEDEEKIFTPALLNGKNYQPSFGTHQCKLYSGSRFVGYQKTKNNCYGVEVIIQYVDFENLYLCGHFKISGLTEEYPTLTTFFDGEIVSSKYPFLTRKYDADSDVDNHHWAKLIPSKHCANMFNDEYDYSKITKSNYILMRWKESHIVNDHKIKDLNGLSFSGFYYIIFSKIRGSIDGFYYYKHSEAQSLSLKHDPDRTSKIFEIR